MNPVLQVVAVSSAQVLLAWATTYLLHSTLLFGVTWIAIRLRRPAARVEEVLWRLALFGAPLTAACRLLVAGREAGAAVAPSFSTLLARSPTAALLLMVVVPGLVCLAWLVTAAGAWRSLFGQPHPRLDDDDAVGWVRSWARRSGFGAPILLTRTAGDAGPAAIGWREISLPATPRLEPSHRRSILAHELGHLVRHDPWWRCGADLAGRALFFQPLNGWVRRRLRDLAEYESDAFAVRMTGDRRSLVEALGRLAQRADPAGGPVASLAARPSRLLRRAERILDVTRRAAPPRSHSAALASATALAGATVLVAIALVGPAITASPKAAANQLPWLAPSTAPPGPALLAVRHAERDLRHTAHRLMQ